MAEPCRGCGGPPHYFATECRDHLKQERDELRAQKHVMLYLFRLEGGVWHRFDGDSLAGIDLKELSVIPTAVSDEMTVGEWWNVKQERDEARDDLDDARKDEAALQAAYNEMERQRDEARAALAVTAHRYGLDFSVISLRSPWLKQYEHQGHCSVGGGVKRADCPVCPPPRPDEAAWAQALEEQVKCPCCGGMLLGYRPGKGPRCRLCNYEWELKEPPSD